PIAKSVASSSLESYFCQKDNNGHNKNTLSLSQKRGSKNKRKNRFILEEQVHFQDTILDKPYYKVKIVKVISKRKVIINITFESNNMNQYIVQLTNIIGFSQKCHCLYNAIEGKKDELHLTSTCPVDTSLILIQSAFTQQNIYSQAAAFAIADLTSCTHLIIKIFDQMKQKQ
ncbi:2478_t:CDS:2, partial [Cetraspora pellucida]